MTATLDLTTATPVEIDTILADLDYERFVAMIKAMDFRKAAREARNYVHYDWRTRTSTPRPDKAKALRLEGLAAEQDEIRMAKEDEMAPYEDEFRRRGGWTRAFLVMTSGTGHVHSSQRCHTCYPTTQFHWVTAYSGKDESEIVDAAGERACTICYPSAPAYVLNRPTILFTKDEEAKAAARAEREAKRAAKDALAILDPATGKVLFKTERGATNDIAWRLDCHFRYEDDDKLDFAFKVASLVAAKRGVEAEALWDELKTKAEKKFRREAIKQIKQMKLGPKGLHYDQTDPANWHASYRKIAQEEGLI